MEFYYEVLESLDEHTFDEDSILEFNFKIRDKWQTFKGKSFEGCKTKKDVADILIALGEEINAKKDM